MNFNPSSGLERFYQFFQKGGSERLHGLDESYFRDLTPIEKEEAWSFLSKRSRLTDEIVSGLFLLDQNRAIELFKKVSLSPLEQSPYKAERQAVELARLTLLHYINKFQPSADYLNQMIRFSTSEFEEVRLVFATALPEKPTTSEILSALKSMIFTETDELVLSSVIMKFMAIYGMDFNISDVKYKEIYNLIRIGSENKKMAAIRLIEEMGEPNFL